LLVIDIDDLATRKHTQENDELIDIYVGMSRNMPERPQKIEVKHAAERAER
jgi:hypothetical protein